MLDWVDHTMRAVRVFLCNKAGVGGSLAEVFAVGMDFPESRIGVDQDPVRGIADNIAILLVHVVHIEMDRPISRIIEGP